MKRVGTLFPEAIRRYPVTLADARRSEDPEHLTTLVDFALGGLRGQEMNLYLSAARKVSAAVDEKVESDPHPESWTIFTHSVLRGEPLFFQRNSQGNEAGQWA
jgi:hypothetical protein